MKRIFKNLSLFVVVVFAFTFTSCKEEIVTPTHELMQGVWEVTEAYDMTGDSMTNIMGNLNVFPTYIWLDDMNGVTSTAGPMFMYVVYGKSKFISAASKIDEVFKYTNLTLTNGEFFMEKDKTVERFTIEMKLKFPTVETISSILDLMGLNLPSFVEPVIYHKFLDVKVEIDDANPEMMVWTFDDLTFARYNIKDNYGDLVSWSGMPVEQFSRCKFVFTKKASTLNQLVDEANTAK